MMDLDYVGFIHGHYQAIRITPWKAIAYVAKEGDYLIVTPPKEPKERVEIIIRGCATRYELQIECSIPPTFTKTLMKIEETEEQQEEKHLDLNHPNYPNSQAQLEEDAQLLLDMSMPTLK